MGGRRGAFSAETSHYERSMRLVAAVFLAAVALCAAVRVSATEPDNLGDLKARLLDYRQYGGYERDVLAVDAEAQAYVEKRASGVTKPALVLDIDETALSNWPEIKANDFGFLVDGTCDQLPRGPCGDHAWETSARAEAIAPTLALFSAARAAGVTVVFITGRDETFRKSTETNLNQVGYVGWLRVVMRPKGTTTESAADYKAPERKRLEDEGYTIIANVGDQPSDLAGGHAERAFLLPNPFYRIP